VYDAQSGHDKSGHFLGD
jgi:hypothetical protein